MVSLFRNMYRQRRSGWGVAGAMVATSLVLAACGGGDEPEASAEQEAEEGDGEEAEEPDTSEEEPEAAEEPEELVPLTYPILAGGGLGSVPGWYVVESGLGEEYGFDITTQDYDSPQAFYADIATGNLEVAYGTPDGLAAQAAAGAPISIISTLSEMSGVIVANAGTEWEDPTSLVGSRFAALEASGTFLTMRSFIEEQYDISFDEDVEVVTASSLPGGPTQVAAGTADFSMSWEPAATVAVISSPDLEVVYELGPDYEDKVGEPLWHFVLVARDDTSLSDEQLDAFVEMMREATTYLTENPGEADRIAVEHDLVEGAYQDAISSGRLPYVVEEPNDQIVGEMQRALAYADSEGGLSGEIPDSFWGN